VRVIAAADPEKLEREDHWSLLASGGDRSPPRSGEALLLIQKLELGQGDLLRLILDKFGFGGAVVDQNSPRLTLQKRSRGPNDPAGPPQPNACDMRMASELPAAAPVGFLLILLSSTNLALAVLSSIRTRLA
jgi:hypothetical protein